MLQAPRERVQSERMGEEMGHRIGSSSGSFRILRSTYEHLDPDGIQAPGKPNKTNTFFVGDGLLVGGISSRRCQSLSAHNRCFIRPVKVETPEAEAAAMVGHGVHDPAQAGGPTEQRL